MAAGPRLRGRRSCSWSRPGWHARSTSSTRSRLRPSEGSILFIREYRELYSVSSETSLASFLGQGIAALVGSRIDGLVGALRTLATTPFLLILVPPLLVGAWLRRRAADFLPWSIYAVVLLAFSAVVSAVHVPHGTFLHSAVALVPHASLLAVLGLTTMVGWVATRRSSWTVEIATRNFTAHGGWRVPGDDRGGVADHHQDLGA